MLRAVVEDIFLIGVTENNLKKIEWGDNLYVQNDDIEVPFDVQIALENTTGMAVEGRTCLTNVFTKESLRQLRRGDTRVVRKQGPITKTVIIFYGETLENVQTIVNDAVGLERKPVSVGPMEFHSERTEDGKTTTKRGIAFPPVFRRDGSPHRC